MSSSLPSEPADVNIRAEQFGKTFDLAGYVCGSACRTTDVDRDEKNDGCDSP